MRGFMGFKKGDILECVRNVSRNQDTFSTSEFLPIQAVYSATKIAICAKPL